MIDSADAAVLSVVGIIVGAAYLFLRFSLRGQFARVQKYKLFRVRDELIYLVATGKLSEDDFVFQLFYGASNYWINQTDGINLRNVVKARVQGLDPAEKAKVDETHRALETKDVEVRKAVYDFYFSMLTILRENSWVLRLLIHAKPVVGALITFGRSAKAFFPTLARSKPAPLQAYEVYQDYETAALAA